MELAPYQKVCDARDFRLLKSSIVFANLEYLNRMPSAPPFRAPKVNIDGEMPFIKN